jgi:glycerate-2-kinase
MATFRDAVEILRKHEIWNRVPLAVRGHLDLGQCGEIEGLPPAESPCFARVATECVGGSGTTARAACEHAASLGYDAQLLATALAGTAREAGSFLAAAALSLDGTRQGEARPSCIVAAGTPRPSRAGAGPVAPAQELVLAGVNALAGTSTVLIAAMSTSGADGDTQAAGAVGTSATPRRAAEAGIDVAAALVSGGAHAVFDALDDLIVSGPTGTNTGQIQLLLL